VNHLVIFFDNFTQSPSKDSLNFLKHMMDVAPIPKIVFTCQATWTASPGGSGYLSVQKEKFGPMMTYVRAFAPDIDNPTSYDNGLQFRFDCRQNYAKIIEQSLRVNIDERRCSRQWIDLDCYTFEDDSDDDHLSPRSL